ncbi:MAG: repair ATPase [Verrucomicrobiales bacterium]|nr:repair ATPase [Verrucomicrobiales bacterium]
MRIENFKKYGLIVAGKYMGKRYLVLILSLVVLVTGCKSTYYAAYEKFGVYKRDLLKKKVTAARDGEKEASEQFKDALTKMRELYNFQGGNLDKMYTTLQKEFDQSTAQADTVHKRVKDMEGVAEDLFTEWEKEIGQISTPSMQSASRQQLRDTRSKYESLHASVKNAERSMDPVLTLFRDHVLFLKHNLNAQAVASLKGEAANIQNEISNLITQMNASIAKADEFIKTMP